jgi:hypothetical protein
MMINGTAGRIGLSALIVGLCMAAGTASAADPPGSRDGVYQIVKATENRVWRLNTQTGEIAVCDLSGDNLVCTTTTDAASVPKKTFEQIEAERAAEQQALDAEREARRERELKLLDKILAFFRELIRTALGQNGSA